MRREGVNNLAMVRVGTYRPATHGTSPNLKRLRLRVKWWWWAPIQRVSWLWLPQERDLNTLQYVRRLLHRQEDAISD